MTHVTTQTERELLAALESILAVAFDVAVNGHLMQEPTVLSRAETCRIYDIARGAILKAQREQRREVQS